MSLDISLFMPPSAEGEDNRYGTCVFEQNITHNLNRMAAEASIYRHMWRPEELGITVARDLIRPLTKGLELLKSDPARFEAFAPVNGWGTYQGLVRVVTNYRQACLAFPDAVIHIWR